MQLFNGADTFIMFGNSVKHKGSGVEIEIDLGICLSRSTNKKTNAFEMNPFNEIVSISSSYKDIKEHGELLTGKVCLALTDLDTVGTIYVVPSSYVNVEGIDNLYNTLLAFSKNVSLTINFHIRSSDSKAYKFNTDETDVKETGFKKLFSLKLDQTNVGFALYNFLAEQG